MTSRIISVEQLKLGDERAFKHLFEEYYQALCLFAVNYLGDDMKAADVVQEVFVKYWEHRSTFDEVQKIRAFLYTVVRNDCLNILRSDKQWQKYQERLESEVFYRDILIEEEALRLFYRAVEQLPPQSKRVIQLALDGMNNRKIAVDMGISENTVHMLKKIAYKKLKEMLREYYYLVFLFLD